MIVIPKRKHNQIVEELNEKLITQNIDLRNMTSDRNKYKELYVCCIKEKVEIDRELDLSIRSAKVRQEKLCKLEYKLEYAKTQSDKLEVEIEDYRNKEIQRLEKLAKRTKKYKVKSKCESRILNIKEKLMSL